MKAWKQNGPAAVIALLMTVGGLLCFLSAFSEETYANALHSPRNGLLLTANVFLRFLTRKTGSIHLLYACTQNRDYLWIAAVLCVLLFAVCYLSARRRVIPALFTAIGAAIGYGSGLFRSDAGIVLLGVGFLLLLTQRLQNGTERKGFFLRAGCIALCLVMLFSVLPTRFAPQENLRTSLRAQIHRLRYEHDDPLPEGDILRDTAPYKTDETALLVQTGSAAKLYLRGFVGEQFDGVRWTEMPNDVLAEYADLFYWLHQSGFSAAVQPALALQQAGRRVTRNVQIDHVSACRKYAFVPSGGNVPTLSDPDALHDSTWLAKDQSVTAQVTAWDTYALFDAQKTVAAQTDTDYLRCERAYAKYVYKTMSDVPETVRAVFRRQVEQSADAALSDKICFVLDLLSGYTETASPQPFSGNDALVWFLEQSKSGSDAMFASAAALLLRDLGVPARYAEGYVVAAEPGETVVTKRDACVWTEYYLDGVGWVPLETVPGKAQTEKQFYASLSSAAETESTLRRAEVRQPQSPMRPGKTPEGTRRFRFILIGCLAAVLTAVLIVLLARRYRFRAQMRAMQALPDKEKITALYAYAQRICSVCGVPMQNADVDALYEEALFSDHPMTAEHVQTMQTFAYEAATACRRKDCGLRRIKHILWDCIY